MTHVVHLRGSRLCEFVQVRGWDLRVSHGGSPSVPGQEPVATRAHAYDCDHSAAVHEMSMRWGGSGPLSLSRP
jgi:hypothetical protein